MSSINPLMTQMNPLAVPASGSGSSSSSSTNPLASLANNSQEFLQLLVAQLQYQDPMNPVSGTAFLSQTAQMTSTSEITQLVQTVNSEVAAVQTSTATSMIGKTITATVAGSPVTGTVSAVTIDPKNGPSLTVGGQSIPLSAVTGVS